MLTLRDSNKSFKIDGHHLKKMTTYNFNDTHSNLQDQRPICEFAKEMSFNIKQVERKSPTVRSLINLKK